MTSNPSKKMISQGVSVTAILFLFIFLACSDGPQSSNKNSSGSGSIALNLSMKNATVKTNGSPTRAIDCGTVSKIQAIFYNQNNQTILEGPEWDCSLHQGTISGIPAGSNYKVVTVGKDSDSNVVIRGENNEITITAGQTGSADVELSTFAIESSSLSPSASSNLFLCDNVTLNWGTPDGAASYEVSMATSSDMSDATVYTTTENTYAPTDLIAETTYYWQVEARDAYGNTSAGTDPLSFSYSTTNVLFNIGNATDGSYPGDFLAINDILYFTAGDVEENFLYSYDGENVSKIDSGIYSLSSVRNLIEYDNQLYFAALDGDDRELFRYDGSQIRKIDINGTGSSSPAYLTVYDGMLFFSANYNGTRQLLKYDGTTAFEVNAALDAPTRLLVANDVLYFATITDDPEEEELYAYDNVNTPTTPITVIFVGFEYYDTDLDAPIVESDRKLYFVARTSDMTEETTLHMYENGTISTIDSYNNENGASISAPDCLTDVNGTLYFSATDNTGDTELFSHSGSGSSATKIDINSDGNSYPRDLTNIDGRLYLAAEWPTIGREPTYCDGTTCAYLDDINSNGDSSPSDFCEFNGFVYFSASDEQYGNAWLWAYDTATYRTGKICSGSCPSYPEHLTSATVNGTSALFYSAYDEDSGYELWSTNDEGTGLIDDINTDRAEVFSTRLTEVNGVLYFSADDGYNGIELWESDGTSSGTRMACDINQETGQGSMPAQFTGFNGKLYFIAYSSSEDTWRLYEYDGTQALKIDIDESDPSVSNLTVVNDCLYFMTYNSDGEATLWKYSGVSDENPIEISPSEILWPNYLTDVNGVLYFSANDSSGDRELYKYDGSTLTRIGINGSGDGDPENLTNINGTLYFTATDDSGEKGLYGYDGVALTSIMSGGFSNSDEIFITDLNGDLYFTADDGSGCDLFKYNDGTVENIEIIDSEDQEIDGLLTLNNTLLLIIRNGLSPETDASVSYELWRSDGTAEGTESIIDDLSATTGRCSIGYLLDDNFIFIQLVSSNSRQVWKSDGTQSNTMLVAETSHDESGSRIGTEMAILNGALFFAYDDPALGPGIWKYCP